jgi:GDPmannose 4,6-dehydratase
MCRIAFECVGLDAEKYIVINPDLIRPAEVDVLVGDPSKAHEQLGWAPTTTLESMIEEMVSADLARRSR